MTPLPAGVSDAELIRFIDGWVSLLEQEDYDAAFAYTDQLPQFGWTPALVRETINWCGPFDPRRRVTLDRSPDLATERKAVYRSPEPSADGFFGEICYILEIDGQPSDRVATFLLKSSPEGVTVHFEGIK